MKYNVALAAHQERSRALIEIQTRGGAPSPEQVEGEAQARLALDEAQANLLAAITRVITGSRASADKESERPQAPLLTR
jgi:hypothetical protein